MIKIDKTDKLYTYLKNLGVENLDETYMELAKLGRYSAKDVQAYFYADFEPSATVDLDDSELERLVDYYADLKKSKPVKKAELKNLLNQYCVNPTEQIQHQILNAYLLDVLYLCCNYKTLHKDVDLQDLIQVANIGLINALKHYNKDAKIDFKDYIIYYVRKEVKKEL